jgi:hypothetical protein
MGDSMFRVVELTLVTLAVQFIPRAIQIANDEREVEWGARVHLGKRGSWFAFFHEPTLALAGAGFA